MSPAAPAAESAADSPSKANEPLSASSSSHVSRADMEQDRPEPPEPPEPDADQKPRRSKLTIALIMLSLGLGVFLVALDITIITTALPTITAHFHSSAGYAWIGSAYLLANCGATPIWGKVSDIWGRKPILLLANIIFMIGSLLAGLSRNINMLIAARVIQGIGGGGLIVLVNICISDLFALRERGIYFGIIGGVWALASSLGPIVGGVLTQKASWRWCFYINLPLDGVAFLIILFVLDLHIPTTPWFAGLKAIDWLGSLTMVGGTTMLLLGLEFGGVSFPWDSATVICLIVFGFVTIALFLLVEHRFAPYPLLPLSIFSKRSNLAALGVCFIHAYVFISGSYFLPLYFQAVLGATPILSGVYLLPTALSLSFLSAFTGVFIKKTGQYLPMIWFGFIFMTIGFGLFIDLTPTSSWAKIIIYQIIAGIGVGPNFQSPLIALLSGTPPRDTATATAAFGFMRNLGSAISVVVGSVFFQNEMGSYRSKLQSALGPELASAFDNGSAGASIGIVQTLRGAQQAVAREAFAGSLSTMWIMYVAISGAGLLVSLLIRRNVLSKQHEETKTGLEAEKAKRAERKEEREERRLAKQMKKDESAEDVERGAEKSEKL